jgi:hypothetical protein
MIVAVERARHFKEFCKYFVSDSCFSVIAVDVRSLHHEES